MVLDNHVSLRKARELKGVSALSHEDPHELALEEASIKILHSVYNIFRRRKNVVCPSDLARGVHHSYMDGPCIMPRKKQLLKRVSTGYATTSFVFAPTNNHHQDGNAKDCLQRDVSERCKNLSSASSTCVSVGSREQPQMGGYFDSRPDSLDDKSTGKMQKGGIGPSCSISMASLTFAPVNKYHQEVDTTREINDPSSEQLLSHPLALLSYIPKDVSLFLAGAVAGATAKTVTAPLDRIKLLMQVHAVKATQEISKRSIGFLEAAMKIGKEEGMQGYWKGNLPQVIRVIPYSAVQLLSYELYKKLFKGNNKELSVAGRLVAGACAGMTSTLVTYPLDVLRLRLAVDPACKTMAQVASTMLREEGLSSFYRGLGPSLLGIAPYIALNFCAFDLIKQSLPEEMRKTPAASFLTAFLSASLATAMCYPLDTVRRQLQMKGTPYLSVWDAIPGIVASDGLVGLYRGFVPNALKNLPNSSIRLTTFDAAKNLISASQEEFQRLLNIRRGVSSVVVDLPSPKRSE
ncbi:hypothetical protein GOP47_0008062 [Adiantum capillus-veneris]|uniref:Uncharacterized protein n=1 Tax=Adiantum capillus-veneris TaxID=13818 RepID=A0A9D4ZJB3_ADICA|nr:hypothetical protein GOP47_0008062 [Adiantum capillus-veneris]